MPLIERKLRDAEQAAEKLVRDHGFTLPIDPFAIAASRNIHVVAKPVSAGGVSGMLIRSGENFAIAYATHIKSEGFQRFSVAHELGHYFLEGHPDAIFQNGEVHESRAGFASSNQIEREADHFAAGLLMPSHLFGSAASRYSDGLDAIKGLAKDCKTSLTASAIRYAELTDAAVAILVSNGSTIDFCFVSKAVNRIPGFKHPKKGSALPRNSLTRDFNQHLENINTTNEDSDSTDLNIWFHTDDEIDASEEVITLGEYGRTLTVLAADLPDEEDEDRGSSWKPPQFRY